jgi:hypothetical protein
MIKPISNGKKMIKDSTRKIQSSVLICLFTACFLLADGYATMAISDVDNEELVNYAFATWIGSGIYRTGDRKMAILRVPLRYTLRTPEEAVPGLKLLLPLTIGYYDYDDSAVNFGTGSFVPGLEFAVPVNKNWTLKPFGQFGVGKDTGGGNLVYIYGGGVRSLVSIPYNKFTFGIGNSLILADERDKDGDIGSEFNMFEAGLDIKHPLGVSIGGRQLDAGLYFVVSRFFNGYEFVEPDGDSDSIKTLFEVGITLGAKEPFNIWKVNLDRIGIDFRFGDNFSGIGLNMGFPF